MIDLATLNGPQRQAVEQTEGPVLVLAGAGSGKTRVLTFRIAHLIEQRLASPHEIMAVTFTNKAAGEVRERVAQLCGPQRFPYLGTFHSLCVRILREKVPHALSMQLTGDPAQALLNCQLLNLPADFTIYDTADQLAVIKEFIKKKQLKDEELAPRKVLSRISGLKNRGE